MCRECLGTNHEATKNIFKKHYGKIFHTIPIKKKWQSFFISRQQGGIWKKSREIDELLEYLRSLKIKTGLASSTREEIVREGTF